MGDSVLCFVMVETREAVEKIDEIAGTPGLDGRPKQTSQKGYT